MTRRTRKPKAPPANSVRWLARPDEHGCGLLRVVYKGAARVYLVKEVWGPLERHDGLRLVGFVLTSDEGATYTVSITPSGWRCSCGDFRFRRRAGGTGCKHIRLTEALYRRMQS